MILYLTGTSNLTSLVSNALTIRCWVFSKRQLIKVVYPSNCWQQVISALTVPALIPLRATSLGRTDVRTSQQKSEFIVVC